MRSLLLMLAIDLMLAVPTTAQCSNTAPVDGNEAISTLEATVALDLLANASDEDGDELTLAITADTCPGTTTVSFGLAVVDRPATFRDDCSIAYTVTDQGGLSDDSTATIRYPADIFSNGFEEGSTSAWTTNKARDNETAIQDPRSVCHASCSVH